MAGSYNWDMLSPIENKDLEPIANRLVKKPKAKPPVGIVDHMADMLASAYSNPGYRGWYCKVVYTLGPSRVEEIQKRANEGREPAKLFARLATEELKKYE